MLEILWSCRGSEELINSVGLKVMSLAIAVRRRVSARRAARACCGLEAHDSPAPDRRCRTARRHRNFDPADTHTHIRSDLEQLETDSAACYLCKRSVV